MTLPVAVHRVTFAAALAGAALAAALLILVGILVHALCGRWPGDSGNSEEQ
jgi:hypothetical protein